MAIRHIDMRRRWVILGVVYLCSLAFAFSFQSIPPILTLVMKELNLSHAEGGLLMSFFALPGIIVSIPAGMLVDRYSQKTMGIVSLALIIVGTAIFALGNSLPLLAIGRVISGLGAMTLLVLNLQLTVQWFTGYEIGTAMGIYNTGMPLGTILSLNTLSVLAENAGWRTSVWVSVGVSVIALIAFVALYAAAPQRKRPAQKEDIRRGLGKIGTPVWLVGIAWALFNASGISFYTFTPDFFESTGHTIASASFLTSLVMLPSFVGSPAVGYLIDRYHHKRLIVGVCAVFSAVLLMGIFLITSNLVLLIVLYGIAGSLMVTPIYSLGSDASGPERLGLGYGIIATCLNVGVLIGPAVTGLMKDVTGTYLASYALMATFVLAIALVMYLLGRRTA